LSRSIVAAIDDMLFASKIRAAAEHLDVTVRFARNSEALLRSVRESKPDLVIVDLHAEQFDPLGVAVALKSDEQLRSIPLLGFFSHVRTDLLHTATEAGYDTVIPRSAFARDLGSILTQS
jgi:PleD family two-component response regulator